MGCQSNLVAVALLALLSASCSKTSTAPMSSTGSGTESADSGTTSTVTTVGSATSATTETSASESSSSASSGVEDHCGDGLLDDDEECDGGPGCAEDCELDFYQCHPLLQRNCEADEGCYSFGTFPDFEFVCLPAGDVPDGGICGTWSDCMPGSTCLFSGNCTRYCDTVTEAECSCEPFTFNLLPPIEGLGFCQ